MFKSQRFSNSQPKHEAKILWSHFILGKMFSHPLLTSSPVSLSPMRPQPVLQHEPLLVSHEVRGQHWGLCGTNNPRLYVLGSFSGSCSSQEEPTRPGTPGGKSGPRALPHLTHTHRLQAGPTLLLLSLPPSLPLLLSHVVECA